MAWGLPVRPYANFGASGRRVTAAVLATVLARAHPAAPPATAAGADAPTPTPESIQAVADLINRYPDRFLFGTDEVAPTTQAGYLKVYTQYAPLFDRLTSEAREKVRKRNYERLFDEARRRVRAWEQANIKETKR
ncbi:MAG: hypothetical protein C5B57_05080 [Blastocatellia bacterium]|nr:MAG: hypothetical protein C5B57_05080 [Blastocatellia bacterium]